MDTKNVLFQNIISEYEAAISKIILCCICELPFPLGIKRLISVLRGEKSIFIYKYSLNQLSTFSILSSFSFEHMNKLIEILINIGLLTEIYVGKDNEYLVLEITEKGDNFLLNKEKLDACFFDLILEEESDIINPSEQKLFIELKALRLNFAMKNNKPAYTVCSDRVLREICKIKPMDNFQLLSTNGVRRNFVDNYGKQFIDLIKKTCIPDDISTFLTPID